MKKADLSINMIIIIAIGLVILLVVIFLLVSRSNNLREGTSCIDRGGVCTNDENCPNSQDRLGTEGCKNQICCRPSGIRLQQST